MSKFVTTPRTPGRPGARPGRGPKGLAAGQARAFRGPASFPAGSIVPGAGPAA